MKGLINMYDEKILLTQKDILEQDFKIDARGYRPQEVDKFLDMVMCDYSEYQTAIKRLKHDLREAISDNEKLRAEVRNLKTKLEIVNDNSSKNVTNLDLLKRISELEKAVFGE